MLVGDGQQREHQRLLLGEQGAEIAPKNRRRSHRNRCGVARFPQSQVEQKCQEKKETELEIRDAGDPGNGLGMNRMQREEARPLLARGDDPKRLIRQGE